MSNFTHLQQKWNKFTHIFVTSTNSPTTHAVFTNLRGCFWSWRSGEPDARTHAPSSTQRTHLYLRIHSATYTAAYTNGPIGLGDTTKGPLYFHSHKRTCSIGHGGTPKEPLSCHSQKRPAPLGRGAHPKGHCPSTVPLSQTNLPHLAGGHIQRAIALPLSETNLPHWVGRHTQSLGHRPARCESKERGSSGVTLKEDFGQMFISFFQTHLFFKECLPVSAQHGARSCDAESELAS